MMQKEGYDRFLDPKGAAIFLFHGVITEQRHSVRNYIRKHLPVNEFASIIRQIAAKGTPMSLLEFVTASLAGNPLPPRAFVVTFDDGFANNCTQAAPVLRELGIPATIFITTEWVDNNRGSWIDKVEQAVEGTKRTDVTLPAPMRGRRTCSTVEEKIRLLNEIRSLVKKDPGDPYVFAEEFCRQFDAEELAHDPELDQMLTWDQIWELYRDPLFTIGGHSCTHRVLELLGDEELENEIGASLAMIAKHTGMFPALYAYPEGLPYAYSDRVIARLKSYGILACPTAEPGINHIGDDPFRLKRIGVV